MNIPFRLSLSLLLLTTAVIGVDTRVYDTIQSRSCFRSMQGMLDSMQDLADKNSNLMTITNIGESYLKNNEGRAYGKYDIPTGGYDIYVVKITDSNSDRKSQKKGKMLITSGVHAREWAPPELLARYIELMVNGYDVNADITWIMQHTEIHAILYVNPDGRWMAEKYPELYWRKNLNPDGGCGDSAYGVDINRNFDFKWGDKAGASGNPCDSDYHGKSRESEPETKALTGYAKGLFPASQRKNNPENQMNEKFGEEITGMYVDLHSSGGYIYYPWGHKDEKSPDDEALQALGRKIHHFNEYKLWAGSQPDFLYEASGDTSDYLYAVMGVASLGFEIGDNFQQECNSFENGVVPINLPPLVYLAKIAQKPYKEVKGPDIFDLNARYEKGMIRVSAHASDSEMVNGIRGFPDFRTGGQTITKVQLYLDVHPDDYKLGDSSWAMQSASRRLESEDIRSIATERSVDCKKFMKKKQCKRAKGEGRRICEWFTQEKTCRGKNGSAGDNLGSAEDVGSGAENAGAAAEDNDAFVEFNSGDETVELAIDATSLSLSPGRHTVYVQATDSDGYRGPVSSEFVEVSQRQRESSLRGSRVPFQ
mmetsp:Transcript_24789/g.44557  ORF Transcript_24789/g.44557 Transcript_24789/m.44557 type:complete len:593 (+) Transcript_24789:138-1916(+)|eukprot:CAMPEP_0201886546 /NCGR_PEP_ID=MMETSP0902-20130614/22372_1 /ASSEMBLY_ACC=CAM_ASM_000551 /TAXON_ID=420261 /ORGANISM="Thalassiosira antarctica, Strain CCMP982" /LENGTH=592 /DNA_ID=CAMNT_0048416153 /DNA_START=88 /DNA_END=1866 /DNA_ORIENTATION=-